MVRLPRVRSDSARVSRTSSRRVTAPDGEDFEGRGVSRGTATRDVCDLRVHYRASGSVRGRCDLPCAQRAWVQDCPENLLRPSEAAAVEAGAARCHGHGDLAGYYEHDEHGKRKPESLYGSLKMWAHLNREGIGVARCTVERLMRAGGWCGVTRRRRPPRTTEADPAHHRAPDRVNRDFGAHAPNRR